MISVWVRVGQSWAKSHGQRSGNLSQSNGAKTQSYVLAVLHPQKDPKRYFKKKEAASRILSIRASLEANSNIEQSAIRIGIQEYWIKARCIKNMCCCKTTIALVPLIILLKSILFDSLWKTCQKRQSTTDKFRSFGQLLISMWSAYPFYWLTSCFQMQSSPWKPRKAHRVSRATRNIENGLKSGMLAYSLSMHICKDV